ncbi:MAG: hypothetical protein KBT10_04035 [Bacteroidales bacterium]|nr:hypothetical protein [Candidatus Sodaliphilus aphodohippi]
MKKVFGIMMLLALMVGATACGDDNEPKSERELMTSYNIKNLMIFDTNMGETKTEVPCKFNLYSDLTADLVDPSSSQSNLLLRKAPFTAADNGDLTFRGTHMGYFDTSTGEIFMSNTYQEKTTAAFTLPLYTALSNGDKYVTTSEKYYRFNISQYLITHSTGDIYIHNIKFVDNMPAQKQIRIPVGNIDAGTNNFHFAINDKGYEVTMDEVIPYFLNGTTELPMASRKITNLELKINLAACTYSIAFDCFGLHFTDEGNLRK